ncbi:MAG TPA: ATP-dependent RNA helicase, partial [Chitinophagaceae bacterium]|nr:ATP-dependent RNA helicase [Chitinophagaceae bacterium]
ERRQLERGAPDQGRRKDPNGRKKFDESGNFTKLFVNLGTKDGFYKASFLQFILDMSDLRKDVLGRIDMKEMNSWVEVDAKSAKQMIRAIDGKNYRGRKIRMNEANSR